MAHKFHFFRAGGVDQVSLRDGSDLLALSELDQKLWVALAMPTKGVDVAQETLELLDGDKDGRVHVDDVLAAITWIKATFKTPNDLLTRKDAVKLDAIADPKIVASAKHMLGELGKKDADSISVADSDAITKMFIDTVLNGDGIVIPASTSDADLKKTIEDAIASVGSKPDRSGKPGIDKEHADAFFVEIDKRAAWLNEGKLPATAPIEALAPAGAAFDAVRAKIDDYFTRARVGAYDARIAVALDQRGEAELQALAHRTLGTADEKLGELPLAKVDPSGKLPLGTAINPAWQARMQAFVTTAVTPLIEARTALTAEDIARVADKLEGYAKWAGAKPATKVDALDAPWVIRLASSDLRAQLAALIAKDLALEVEFAQTSELAKVVRLQRDFGRILRNFVNFSDFYAKQDGIFQAGTLYLDARAMHLCVPVTDPAKHAALAASSDASLIYIDISRPGEAPRQVAAAITNGDADNVFVGRNGLFYDRAGNDWDATIAKLVTNPISIREAFWSPYKKLVKVIEDNVSKRAQAADAAANAQIESAGADIANADKKAIADAGAEAKADATVPAPAAAPPPPAAAAAAAVKPSKIDLGTIAAIGVAIGGVGTLFGALLATLFGLGAWLPIGVLAILLMISGPAMLLAWLKLRRRNLGPLLDANGWAINSRARVNVAFGAAMTELAKLPPGATRSLDDPFADKKTPWRRWVLLIVILGLAGAWYLGKFDKYLPDSVRSVKVLGEHAPAYVAPPKDDAKKDDAKKDEPKKEPAPAAPAVEKPAAK
ncbi:MAG TPA: hypothetical protein VGM88_32265 [Kofleriaceae bacterium]|jgi:hypothetical protein